MRRSLLLSAAILGLTGGAALAQGTSDTNAPDATSNAPAMDGMPMKPHTPMRHGSMHSRMDSDSDSDSDMIRPGHEPGVSESYPASTRASNIESGDTHSRIAPRLPTPAGGRNATAQTYLMDAQRALNARQSGRAQEALERAETYSLTRAVPADAASTPDGSAMVEHIAAARKALGAGDMATAKAAIGAALQMPAQ